MSIHIRSRIWLALAIQTIVVLWILIQFYISPHVAEYVYQIGSIPFFPFVMIFFGLGSVDAPGHEPLFAIHIQTYVRLLTCFPVSFLYAIGLQRVWKFLVRVRA